MDCGPICGLVLWMTTSPSPKLELELELDSWTTFESSSFSPVVHLNSDVDNSFFSEAGFLLQFCKLLVWGLVSFHLRLCSDWSTLVTVLYWKLLHDKDAVKLSHRCRIKRLLWLMLLTVELSQWFLTWSPGTGDPLGVPNANLGGPKRKSGISTDFPQYK